MSKKTPVPRRKREISTIRGWDALALYTVLGITIAILPLIAHSGLLLALNGALQVITVLYIIYRNFIGRKKK